MQTSGLSAYHQPSCVSSKIRLGNKVKRKHIRLEYQGIYGDITKYISFSKPIDVHMREAVSDKYEDGPESINYTNDRGTLLFSLENYESYLDLGQDDLKEITLTHWLEYKGGTVTLVFSLMLILFMTPNLLLLC